MMQREISTYNTEKRFISKNGKTVLVSLTMSLVWSNDGLPKFFILQAIDITRRKEMELELIQKNTELEETRQSLVNKVNQLEDLSHIIAHNLRGPAGNIKMLSEALLDLLEKKQKGITEPEGTFTEEEATLLIHDSSMSLMESLSTLMQITEIKLNKEIPCDNCDIPSIVNDLCNQLQGAILEKNATITRNFDVKTVTYPRMYLESILYNLISNALKYARPDITPEIDITTTTVNNRIQLTVKDNGLGIDMEKYGARVFKLNQVFHHGFDSKGIGLYITKTMVETMGGLIELHSAPNQGSEFIVTL
jgi:signal transduction histidine kinase